MCHPVHPVVHPWWYISIASSCGTACTQLGSCVCGLVGHGICIASSTVLGCSSTLVGNPSVRIADVDGQVPGPPCQWLSTVYTLVLWMTHLGWRSPGPQIHDFPYTRKGYRILGSRVLGPRTPDPGIPRNRVFHGFEGFDRSRPKPTTTHETFYGFCSV